jgi:hypothetical protein
MGKGKPLTEEAVDKCANVPVVVVAAAGGPME